MATNMETIHNRIYKGVVLGKEIRRSIDKTRTFRVRRGNGYYDSILGAKYQDQFAYTVPSSINNAESEPYRRQWIAAVHKWKYDLTAGQKQEYNDRAGWRLRMSGYNLFMREAMKGLVEMYIDRGDPAAYDKAKEDLTIDGAWHDWDVSTIVPAGAKAVLLIGHLEGNAIDWKINFRKKGNSNEINHADMETIRANVTRHRSVIVSVDVDRIIEYNADNQAWTELNLSVRGWWT